MEQINSTYIRQFIEKKEFDLRATQTKLCTPIINRMCKKMRYGIKFEDIKVCDNLIIDGHHRYVSSLITDFGIISVPGLKSHATRAYEWHNVEFDDNDWDTPLRISYLNKQDAAYNDVDLETLKRIISY